MKSLKRVFIISGVILLVSLIIGVMILARNGKDKSYISVNSQQINQDIKATNEVEEQNIEEPMESIENNSIIEEQTSDLELQDNQNTENEIIKENIVQEKNVLISENKTIVNSNTTNKQESISKPVSTDIEDTQDNNDQNQAPMPQPEIPKQETTTVEEQKKEEPTKVEEIEQEMPKPVETPPVRTYKVNTTYIEKLRSTIIMTVTNNISALNKYGITSVEQYKVIDDSSICTYNGGNRNGWTFENTTAYNTFVNSILKGTSMKIYAVDEYYNGEYIQTLCYYGH